MSKKQKAFEWFNQGKRPSDPEVKGLGLSPKTRYNYYQEWKHSCGGMETDGTMKGESSVLAKTPGGIIRFTPMTITCEYTPIMYVARQAAAELWGWPSDLPFEDFCDTILYYFFKDRGVTLQGYIVDEEVEKQQ